MHLPKGQPFNNQLADNRTLARTARIQIPLILNLRCQIRRDIRPNLTGFETRPRRLIRSLHAGKSRRRLDSPVRSTNSASHSGTPIINRTLVTQLLATHSTGSQPLVNRARRKTGQSATGSDVAPLHGPPLSDPWSGVRSARRKFCAACGPNDGQRPGSLPAFTLFGLAAVPCRSPEESGRRSGLASSANPAASPWRARRATARYCNVTCRSQAWRASWESAVPTPIIAAFSMSSRA
jgi:hypothetical protein